MSDGEESPTICSLCGNQEEKRECDQCGGTGFFGHDCGEDTCCCADPHDNMLCDACGGSGWIWYCPHCYDEMEEGFSGRGETQERPAPPVLQAGRREPVCSHDDYTMNPCEACVAAFTILCDGPRRERHTWN